MQAVYWVVVMPALPTKGQMYFLKGKGPQDLASGNIRAIGFGYEPDGLRFMYDCIVTIAKN